MLKRALENSQGDFTIVVDAIHRTLTHQINELKRSMENDRFKSPNTAPVTWLFSRIVNIVSMICFQHVFKLYEAVAAKEHHQECRDKWLTTSIDIPCAHDIEHCLNTHTPIMPSQIHRFWKQLCWEGVGEHNPEDTVPLNSSQVLCNLY